MIMDNEGHGCGDVSQCWAVQFAGENREEAASREDTALARIKRYKQSEGVVPTRPTTSPDLVRTLRSVKNL